MEKFSSETTRRLLHLKRVIREHFSASNWQELGLLTQCSEIVEQHSRLLRSLHFGDEDYESCIIEVLENIIRQDIKNLDIAEDYVAEVVEGTTGVSDAPAVLNKCVCAPEVFKIPDGGVDRSLVALMTPFDSQFNPICDAIKEVAFSLGLSCKRADDIWEDSTIIQDVFSLIYRAAIVICDFSSKNPNVLYEAGIAHTLGRKVIPLAQHISDIPFDLRHHRHLMYLPNTEGLCELKAKLSEKLRQEIGIGEQQRCSVWS